MVYRARGSHPQMSDAALIIFTPFEILFKTTEWVWGSRCLNLDAPCQY